MLELWPMANGVEMKGSGLVHFSPAYPNTVLLINFSLGLLSYLNSVFCILIFCLEACFKYLFEMDHISKYLF